VYTASSVSRLSRYSVGMLDDLGGIDRTADRPPYRQIAELFRHAIASGQLAPGSKLASEAELGERYEVSRMTARRAIHELRAEGLVVAKVGRGVFVAEPRLVRRVASDRFARRHRDAGKAAFTIEAEKEHRTPTVDRIEITRGPAPAAVVERLGISSEQPVVIRARRYLLDGQPVETAVSYVPADLADGTAIAEVNTGPGGIYARLEETGHILERFVEEVSARMPSSAERAALALPEAVPVLVVVRTAFKTGGRAVEVCDTVKAAPVYLLAYDFPAR
jgi:GntR family transcriptional regulator